MSAPSLTPVPVSLPPLARAVLDACAEGVVVLDASGRVVYANAPGRRALSPGAQDARRLDVTGARRVPLRVGAAQVGEALLLPAENGGTLADQERRAILDALELTSGRLAEAARRLGISRTTLWRRLKSYGVAFRSGAPH